MTRKLRIIGMAMALGTVLAVIAASGAFAEEEELPKRFETPEFSPTIETGEKGSVTFTAEAEDEFTCTSHYESEMATGWVTEFTVTPSYTSCSAVGFKADVNFEGCHYQFTLVPGITKTGGGETHTSGPVHILCPENKEIRFTKTMFGFPICSIGIPEQTPTEPTVDTKNEGLGNTRSVLFTWTVKGLAYNVENGSGACGEEGGHLFGALDGAIKVLAYKDNEGKKGEQTGFRISGN